LAPAFAPPKTPASIRLSGPRSSVKRSIGSPTGRETILVACSKCDWRAAFSRDELIASHRADYPMPDHLAAPSCSRLGSPWDRCAVHYVEPIEGARYAEEEGLIPY